MGDVDADTLSEAARRYTGLRRRYWRFFLGGFALFAVLGTPLLAFDTHLNSVGRALIGVPLGIGFLTCWVGAMLSWSSLTRFRCPRCGKRFIMSWSSSWPTSDCKHCFLRLGPPRAAVSP